MTRSSFLCGLFGLFGVGLIGALPLACSGGGVGDPCIPEDEYDPQFAGFKVSLDNIESRSFQCQTRICLAYKFQGRVSCPLGQPQVDSRICTGRASDGGLGPGGGNFTKISFVNSGGTMSDAVDCPSGEDCVETAAIAQDCDPGANPSTCPPGSTCDPKGKFCRCDETTPVPATGYACDLKTHQYRAFLCHKKNTCQQPLVADGKVENCNADGSPKDCCIPGTDKPISAEVCSQCNDQRSALKAVYCSCRCDVDTENHQAKDPNFNFCDCPTGFECKVVRHDIGLGDPLLAGSYCIQAGTFVEDGVDPGTTCTVDGHKGAACSGTQSGVCSGG